MVAGCIRLDPRVVQCGRQEAPHERRLEFVERLGQARRLVGHRHVTARRLGRVVQERHAQRSLAVDGESLGANGVHEKHDEDGRSEAVIGNRLTRPHASQQPADARQIGERIEAHQGIEDSPAALGHGVTRYLPPVVRFA